MGDSPNDAKGRRFATFRRATARTTVLALCAVSLAMACGCASAGQRARLAQDAESLRRDKERLERLVAQRDGAIARLEQQVENLKGFSESAPADLFAPASLEIARLSGGADYDGKPGDDGITIYLRPLDADGDVVKAPGRITVQLSDPTNAAAPRVIGAYVFDKPNELRKLWFGRFGTNHYRLQCPFPAGAPLPTSRRVVAYVEMVDYLTGRPVTAVKELSFRTAP